MRYVILISFLLFLNSSVLGQVSMEVLVPVGISSHTPASIDRINEVIGPNDYNYKSGISTGLDLRLSGQIGRNFTLQLGLLYRRMQIRTVESLSRGSYSWTFKETHYRFAEHQGGIGVNFRYAFLHFQNSKLSAQLSTNILFPVANEVWIKQERRSYFNEETEYYEYYQSEEYQSLDNYLNAGLSIVYSLGKGPFHWVFEAGYDFSYFQEEYRKRSEIAATDWNNFYVGAGISFQLFGQLEQEEEKEVE